MGRAEHHAEKTPAKAKAGPWIRDDMGGKARPAKVNSTPVAKPTAKGIKKTARPGGPGPG